jgi:cytochrome c-type biogenesis protein CcsB
MKIHVPANFIGYGTFSLAAMTGFAYLIKAHGHMHARRGAPALWGAAMALALLLALEAVAFRKTGSSTYWLIYFAIFAAMFGAVVAARRRIAERLPARELLDDLMYRSIAVGFGFFTIATILGALWAAEAWGAYWSWDPKETWALIVWLNYAAWLHMRQMKGMRGAPLAWWALGGLLVTTFAFLGVNMFLSGLHSYGQL